MMRGGGRSTWGRAELCEAGPAILADGNGDRSAPRVDAPFETALAILECGKGDSIGGA
jgi:hypothetical protein